MNEPAREGGERLADYGDLAPMKFPDASGVPANMLPLSDGSAFDQLKLLVDSEGANLAAADWLGMLAAVGIVRGQPFNPDAHTRGILDRAAKTAYKMSRVIGFEEVLNGSSLRIYPDRRWLNPMDNATPSTPSTAIDLSFVNNAGQFLALDARIWFFTDYYSISPGMLSRIPGKGALYMIGFTDSDSTPLSGGSHYRLSLPANIPAANFWSVTLYEAENASVSPTASLSRRSVRAITRLRMPTAARTFTSAPKHRLAIKPTGSRPCRARGISQSFGSTDPRRQP